VEPKGGQAANGGHAPSPSLGAAPEHDRTNSPLNLMFSERRFVPFGS